MSDEEEQGEQRARTKQVRPRDIREDEEFRELAAASSLDIPEVYGSKYHIFVSDRDARLVFGTSIPAVGPTGESIMMPRYRIAVTMPMKTLVDLARSLASLVDQMMEEERLNEAQHSAAEERLERETARAE